MRFKTPRQQTEFDQLKLMNPKLRHIALSLDSFCQAEFGKDICITDIYRTQEEFNALYSATPLERRPTSSPHLTWGAFDVRSSECTTQEKQSMVQFLQRFSYGDGSARPVALLHTIAGNVEHFHVQRGKT